MFDGESFGKEMVEIVRGFVAAELEPVLASNLALSEANAALTQRVVELETRGAAVPEKGEPGDKGERGDDGAACDMDAVRLMVGGLVDEAVAALPAPEKGERGDDGASADMARLEALIEEHVAAKVAAIPPARDGRDVEDIEVTQNGAIVEFAFTVGEARSIFEVELPQGPEGKPGVEGKAGAPGKLELARAWTDEVHYEGSVRTHSGGTWQAMRDTAKEPPHEDWICLASSGADGREGAGFNLRELWQADGEYKRLDVVVLNGAAWAAKVDNPGPCPGDGWQLFSKQGKAGEKGERGYKGDRGDAGPPVASASIDEEGVQRFVNADGTTVECDLYPLLSRFAAK